MRLDPIPVLRPRLPQADSLLPYLRRIDQTRIYSNMGPLAQSLGQELGRHFKCPAHPLANATLALAIALRASGAPAGSLCMVPSWTFVASGHAILLAGLVPWLVDVEPATGMLSPEMARTFLAQAPAPVGAVMPVGAFGRPLDLDGWQTFSARHRVAVVADAAAGFDTAAGADFAVVVSLHATKVLGAGEGAFVLCRDAALLERCVALSNFGFLGSRLARMAGMNAKLSEYHAAVALAALEQWPDQRARVLDLTGRLARALPAHGNWGDELGRSFAANTLNLEFPCGWQAAEARFTAAAIETRRWWGPCLHHHPAFAQCPRLPTPEAERRARHMLGLPFHDQLDDAALARINATVRACLDDGP